MIAGSKKLNTQKGNMVTLVEIFQFFSIKNMKTKKQQKLLMIPTFDRVLSNLDDVFTLFFRELTNTKQQQKKYIGTCTAEKEKKNNPADIYNLNLRMSYMRGISRALKRVTKLAFPPTKNQTKRADMQYHLLGRKSRLKCTKDTKLK